MIENDLKRIADALEKIAENLANPLRELKAEAPKVKKVKEVVADPVVEAPEAPVAPVTASTAKLGIMGVPPPAPVVAQNVLPSTPEELRLLAQKVAQQLGPQTLAFTSWVMTDLLKPYGVEKMMEVPANAIPEAAKMIIGYAKKAGVNV